MAPPALARGLELIAYCHPDLPGGLRGDSTRIRQVLINLVSNAVKFTSSGEVVVSAQLVSEDHAAAIVRFKVSDTGIGIADEDRQRLFEPFAQADATTTRRYGGSGLGLAICVRLVAAMGSELELVSEVGKGSTFHFDLSLEKGPISDMRPLDVSNSSLATLRALIVDDNATNRWILSAQLHGWQMDADLAEDGASALILMREAATAGRPYHIAVLDMNMPEMDGVELARTITADPVLIATKLVLLTSGGDVDAQTAAEVGLAARLTKPVRQGALRAHLLQVAGSNAVIPAQRRRFPVTDAAQVDRGHVLVVEDNHLNQLVAQGLLTSLGYSFHTVGDGLQAVAALTAQPTGYSAVLMDCHMPEMDGFEATKQIRQREGDIRHTPIIAMTASALAEDRDACMAAGMDDFVTKPVDPRALGQSLDRWSTKQPQASAAAPPDVGLHRSEVSPAGSTNGAAAGNGAVPAAVAVARSAAGTPAATAATIASSAIDFERLDALRRLGPADGLGLLPMLVTVFVDDVPARLTAVEQANSAGDAVALYQAAHQLKGAAGNVGAVAVSDICAELQRIGRSGQTAAPELVDQLATALEQAVGALHDVVSTSSAVTR